MSAGGWHRPRARAHPRPETAIVRTGLLVAVASIEAERRCLPIVAFLTRPADPGAVRFADSLLADPRLARLIPRAVWLRLDAAAESNSLLFHLIRTEQPHSRLAIAFYVPMADGINAMWGILAGADTAEPCLDRIDAHLLPEALAGTPERGLEPFAGSLWCAVGSAPVRYLEVGSKRLTFRTGEATRTRLAYEWNGQRVMTEAGDVLRLRSPYHLLIHRNGRGDGSRPELWMRKPLHPEPRRRPAAGPEIDPEG